MMWIVLVLVSVRIVLVLVDSVGDVDSVGVGGCG